MINAKIECKTMIKKSTEPQVSYIKLKDVVRSVYEYFPLYKDAEIGFCNPIQSIPESVKFIMYQSIDDDCPTEEDQIRIAKKDLKADIKGALESLFDTDNDISDLVNNEKHNPKFKDLIQTMGK